MKILDIVTQCCYRTGDPAFQNLFADEDNAREWLGYISQALQSIIREHNWSMLTKDSMFTTEADVKNYALPEDYSRMAIYKLYNRTNQTAIPFANSDAEHNKIMHGDESETSVRFRIMGGNISLTYPISAGQEVYYTYLSKYGVKGQNNVTKEYFTSNEDTFLLNDELLILKAISLRAVNLGLPEADRREADYQTLLNIEMNNDGANVNYNLFDCGFTNKTTPDDWSIND